eukprot:844083_1
MKKKKQLEKELKQKQESKEESKQESKEEPPKIPPPITDYDLMQEMEYDILQYLSIPHILYHHNLKLYYENHKNSKLSKEIQKKYSNKNNQNPNTKSQIKQNNSIDSYKSHTKY